MKKYHASYISPSWERSPYGYCKIPTFCCRPERAHAFLLSEALPKSVGEEKKKKKKKKRKKKRKKKKKKKR